MRDAGQPIALGSVPGAPHVSIRRSSQEAGKPSCRQHAKARMCPSAPYSSISPSRVTSVNSYSRAVAMRMRSAGSRGGTPGREVNATSTDGGMSARLTPGSAQNRPNQISGLASSESFAFADRIAISHAVIGETTSRDRIPCASLNSRAAGSRKGSPPRNPDDGAGIKQVVGHARLPCGTPFFTYGGGQIRPGDNCDRTLERTADA